MGYTGTAAVGMLAGVLSLAVYLTTLCPTVYVEGSGELIGATYLLGTPHPTGYPLYCLLGRLVSLLLPFDSPAYEINAVSALAAASAVGVLCALLCRRGCHPGVALGASLVFGFSATYWSQAVIAEVYGMAMLGAVLWWWLALHFADEGSEKAWLGFAYLSGMSLTLHLSLVLLWPAAGLLLWHQRRAFLRDAGVLGRGLGMLALGYSPVLYLFIRNGKGEAFHWGTMSSASQWWDHLNGALYRGSFFSLPPAAMLLNLERWGRQLLVEFNPVLIPLVLWGAWVGHRRERPWWCLAGGALACNLAVALNYHRDPNGIGVFFLISILTLAVYLAWGLQDLADRCAAGPWRVAVRWVPGPALALLVLWTQLAAADRSGVWIPHQYGSAILAQLPEGGVLVAEGDDAAFVIDYLHRVEGLRPDLTLVNRLGRGRDLLARAEGALEPAQQAKLRMQRERELLLTGDRPVHYLHARRLPVEGFRLVPTGLSYRAWPADQAVPANLFNPVPEVPNASGAALDPWVRKLQANYAFMRGEYFLAQADTASGISAYLEAARLAPDSRSTRFNVALMLLRCNRLDEAWLQARAAETLDPWNLEVYRLQAQIRMRGGQRAEAELLLKKADEISAGP